MRVKPEAQDPEFARHEGTLRWPDHANGDVRLASQQIFRSVRQHELDGDARMGFSESRKARRKHLGSDHLAGRDPHRAAFLLRFAGSNARESIGSGGHRFRVGHEGDRVRGRVQAGLRSREKRKTERLFQRVDVTADGRLRQGERAGGGREAAVTNDNRAEAMSYKNV